MLVRTPMHLPKLLSNASLSLILIFQTGICDAQPISAKTPFHTEIAEAMNRMMTCMMVAPTDDVDRDFVLMMRPHHQGAIAMAVSELRYGRNAQLRRIAQEIIVEQQQEIVAMTLALGQPLPVASPSPTQERAGALPNTEVIPHCEETKR